MERPGTRIDAALERLLAARALTGVLTAGLSEADATPQSMPDASPAKWHLAHTTWFFETFVLQPHRPGHRPLRPEWAVLFNSYYESAGPRHPRPKRGLLTRPTLAAVRAWREQVDAALAAGWTTLTPAGRGLAELGRNHEEQHQELILTDLLHLFSENPLAPALWPAEPWAVTAATPMGWVGFDGGVVAIGHHPERGFGFDAEGPRHEVLLRPFALADRLVTNGEWLEFIADGGYRRPLLWLSDGWAWVGQQGIEAPLYWRRDADGGWRRFTLQGEVALDPAAPVSHVSHYEADAFAAWAGARLPTEAEWEHAANGADPADGNLLDGPGPAGPRAAAAGAGLRQMFGDCWEWTGSAFLPYPGFRAAEGAVGEYNGKFMSGQMVLKGGSCFTPRGHIRASYRNFFPPSARWQVTGVRLARDG